jgi:hypothetical protein
MTNYTYEELVLNLEIRHRFFNTYDLIIRDLIEHGYLKPAIVHKRNRKRLYDEISSLD